MGGARRSEEEQGRAGTQLEGRYGEEEQGGAGTQLEGGYGKEAMQRRIDTGAGDEAVYLLSLSMPSSRFRFHFCDLRRRRRHRRQ